MVLFVFNSFKPLDHGDRVFHWLNLDALVFLLLILSRISLLTLPISDLLGLIRRQVGLLVKFGLWSFSVINASLLAVASTLSSIPSFVAIFFVFRMNVSYGIGMRLFVGLSDVLFK